MNMSERIAAKRKLAAEKKAVAVAATKPRIRVRSDGKIIIRMYFQWATPKPASNVHQLVKYERQPVVVGGKCHHCHPNRPGRWVNPATGAVGKCFVCNGMGIISERDRAFDDARMRGERGPLCDVRSA